MKNMIFVCGTGRSGTHLVGRSIASHPNINGRIEEPATFKLITKIASNQDVSSALVTYCRKRVLRYRLNRVFKNNDSHVLEKSHPSIWLVEYLLGTFPSSKYIGVYRDVLPTVSSMLKHRGVRGWFSQFPSDKENRFLGINKENKELFGKLTIEEKCAARWLSHYQELERLKALYPEQIHLIHYDEFVKHTKGHLSKTANFLGVENSFDPEEINLSSLDKWKGNLDQEAIARIQAYVKKYK